MRKRAVTIAAAGLKRCRFMEILAFMRIPAKLNAYSAGNPQHSGNKKSFSHADCPEVRLWEAYAVRRSLPGKTARAGCVVSRK